MPNSLVAQPGVSEGHELFTRKYQVSLRVIFWGCTHCRLYLLGTQRIPEPCRGGHSHTGPCSCDQPSAVCPPVSSVREPHGPRVGTPSILEPPSPPCPERPPRQWEPVSKDYAWVQPPDVRAAAGWVEEDAHPRIMGVWGTTKGPLRPRKPVPGGRRPSGKQTICIRRERRSSRPGCCRGRGTAGDRGPSLRDGHPLGGTEATGAPASGA